jgi:hypothetical protein
MTPKQVKRLERLLKSIDGIINQMSHADLRELVEAWNGPPNVRQNLIDFADWQEAKLRRIS